jgi:hypothetical protein
VVYWLDAERSQGNWRTYVNGAAACEIGGTTQGSAKHKYQDDFYAHNSGLKSLDIFTAFQYQGVKLKNRNGRGE